MLPRHNAFILTPFLEVPPPGTISAPSMCWRANGAPESLLRDLPPLKGSNAGFFHVAGRSTRYLRATQWCTVHSLRSARQPTLFTFREAYLSNFTVARAGNSKSGTLWAASIGNWHH